MNNLNFMYSSVQDSSSEPKPEKVDLDEIDESARNEKISKIERARDGLVDINRKIMELIDERYSRIVEIEDMVSDISHTRYFIGIGYGSLEKEWQDKRMDGDIVKTVVSRIRKIFFDDEDENFRKFEFSWMSTRGRESTVSCITDFIEFTFTDGTNEFGISIPTVNKKMVGDHFSCFDESSTRSYYRTHCMSPGFMGENWWLGNIRIMVKIDEYSKEEVCSSMSIDEIRTYLKSLVGEIDRKKQELVEDRSKRFERYVYGFTESWTERHALDENPVKEENFKNRRLNLETMLREEGYLR